jgi:hypothetical protein
MKRRTFITSSIAASGLAGLAPGLGPVAAEGGGGGGGGAREFYELRLYHLRRGPKQKLFDDYAREAMLPALNRNGVGPVGVFNVAVGPDSATKYVLIPYKKIEDFAGGIDRMRSDAQYQQTAAPFTGVPATDPSFVRVESSLMVAFEGLPKLEAPAGAAGNKPRLFELRIYESHSKRANKKKIEMFNQGEIAIFRRAGLQPVFFGETLIGGNLPNLTYMLVFENMAERDKNWGVFASDPEWKTLSTTPGYTDAEIVSNISNLFLRPAPYSQI